MRRGLRIQLRVFGRWNGCRWHSDSQPIAFLVNPAYRKGMADLKFEVPVTEEVEVDAETLAAIDRGLKAVKEGRVVSSEEARQRIEKWFTKSSTPKTR